MPINPIALGQLDHALIIHVWHLDTLDDLSAYVAHFTPNADRLVTYPDSFSPKLRETIAEKLPGASYFPVKNMGQDVGALFQLMDQVDLSVYAFICKIHTKKGRSMPDDWRRALLGGVLGSNEQVEHIVKTFREDMDVQLAGARQLYLHGSTNLGLNTTEIEKTFGDLINDFDFRERDWGFIAGTCFWIRTDALLRIRDCPIVLEVADTYVPDGTIGHAAERMFGMNVELSGGKVMLQDLRFPDSMPEVEPHFPDNLPKGDWQIIRPTLSSLIGGAYAKSVSPVALQSSQTEPSPFNHNRIAVFASYSSGGYLPPQTFPYLAGLKSLSKAIVVVCDNDLAPEEYDKLASFADHVIIGRHGENDFGSYKRGLSLARENGLLDDADDLILCNDSWYGPVGSFAPMFAKMEARALDFWGAIDSQEFSDLPQSSWVVLGRKVFSSDAFNNFIIGVEKQKNVQLAMNECEFLMAKTLVEAGFTAGVMVENHLMGVHPKDPSYNDLTLFPIYALRHGLPFVKVKALRAAHHNADGQNRLLAWLRENAPAVYKTAVSDVNIKKFEDADSEAFSLIMPTRNRAWCIVAAITSVMAQTHRNFELLIVDDGSTDGTEDLVARKFAKEMAEGRIKYLKLSENVGVCSARNIGLAHARNPWIAYIDSDNAIRPYYLTMMANAIVEHRDHDVFYGSFIHVNKGTILGREFDRKRLLAHNYIDLGVFIHRRSLISRFGIFNPDLKRLVDWDLIIRFTAHQAPKFIPRVFLDYNDEANTDRITVSVPLSGAVAAIHSQNSVKPTVSTAIISYNHQEFLVEAIESVLAQKGNFTHDIMISDDGSTDGSREIIDHYAKKHPNKIRDISRNGNFGVSENYKHCFREAAGKFVAILEGDDYWIDDEKNLKQAQFLAEQTDATMVFSRVEVFDTTKNTHRLLKRQDGLGSLLTGADFARNEHLNLIANFSSSMFRRDVMRSIPSAVYLPRLNEIALSFYMDRIGKIGFIDKVMGIYRQNSTSVWTGASQASQLKQAIAIRENALRIARADYLPKIRERLDEKKILLVALESAQAKSNVA